MSKDLLAQWSQLQRKLAGFHHGDPAEHSAWTPNTDVYDTPEGLVVKVELAGVLPQNVQVQLAGDAVIVEGVRRDPYCGATSAGYRFRQMEVEYGPFRRIVPLPHPVDAARARATFAQGFLELNLPRARERTGRRVKVTIQE